MKSFILILVTLVLISACDGPREGPAASSMGESSQTASATGIQVTQGWVREMPEGATVGAGYLVLENKTSKVDRLIHAESVVAPAVEIHAMSTEGEVMRMRPLERGLQLPSQERVELRPGGSHLMFIRPATRFVAGEAIVVRLAFEHAPPQEVSLRVHPLVDHLQGEAHQHPEQVHGAHH